MRQVFECQHCGNTVSAEDIAILARGYGTLGSVRVEISATVVCEADGMRMRQVYGGVPAREPTADRDEARPG